MATREEASWNAAKNGRASNRIPRHPSWRQWTPRPRQALPQAGGCCISTAAASPAYSTCGRAALLPRLGRCSAVCHTIFADFRRTQLADFQRPVSATQVNFSG